MEDVEYYVTCILNRIPSMAAWQYLTAGAISGCICLLLLIDLIRESAHHSFTILSAVITELCSQVVKTEPVKNQSLLLAAEQALSHICKGYNLKEM